MATEITYTPTITPGFYSLIFLVPKKDKDKYRMIHSFG